MQHAMEAELKPRSERLHSCLPLMSPGLWLAWSCIGNLHIRFSSHLITIQQQLHVVPVRESHDKTHLETYIIAFCSWDSAQGRWDISCFLF